MPSLDSGTKARTILAAESRQRASHCAVTESLAMFAALPLIIASHKLLHSHRAHPTAKVGGQEEHQTRQLLSEVVKALGLASA